MLGRGENKLKSPIYLETIRKCGLGVLQLWCLPAVPNGRPNMLRPIPLITALTLREAANEL